MTGLYTSASTSHTPWRARSASIASCNHAEAWANMLGWMSAHKYASEFGTLAGCPPACEAAAGVAFRFVHKPLNELSFVPVAIKRTSKAGCCRAWSLSMYDDEARAVRKYGELLKKYPHIANDIGDHLAKGTLQKTHGEMTQPSHSGHFDLFEYSGVKIHTAFTIVKKL